MWISCVVCSKPLMDQNAEFADKDVICCKECEHACNSYMELSKRYDQQYRKLHDYENAIEELLSKVSEQLLDEKESITCSTKFFDKLIEINKPEKDNKKEFLFSLCARLRIVADAIGLFIGKYQNKTGSETLAGRLKILCDSVMSYDKHFGDKNDYWKIDQTDKSIIELIKLGKENLE